MLRHSLLLLLLLLVHAAAECSERPDGPEIEIAGFGRVYVGDFRYDAARDRAELFNGVCFVSEARPRWTVEAPRMQVEALESAPRFSVERASLELRGFTLFAETLRSTPQGFALEEVALSNDRFSGAARAARYTLGGRTTFRELSLRLGNFRVASDSAVLVGDTLVLEGARATTCACEGPGLYTLSAPRVRIDLAAGLATVRQGALEMLGLRLALAPRVRLLLDGAPRLRRAGLEVGGAALLPTPALPEPVGEILDEGAEVVLPVALSRGIALELGVAGLDEDHPLGPVSLLRLAQGNLRAVIGRAGPGLRADLLLRQPLAPGVGFDFSLTNRHWEEAGFLHEGTLGLYAGNRLRDPLSGELGGELVYEGQTFTAFSSQLIRGTPVLSPRLGVRASAVYTPPRTPLGNLSLRGESSLTYYPRYETAQFGLRLAPAWRGRFGPLRVAAAFDRQFTNSASPFSVGLDRLEPRSTLSASAELLGGRGPHTGRLGVWGRYNFLARERENPLRQLRVSARSTLVGEGMRLTSALQAELAGLAGAFPEAETRAFLGAESALELRGSALELGFRARYNLMPRGAGLELLEVSASYPVRLSDLTLRPFLALNAAPLFADTPVPVVSGYGLELAVRSCCGTLIASYRLHDGAVATAFDFRVVPDGTAP